MNSFRILLLAIAVYFFVSGAFELVFAEDFTRLYAEDPPMGVIATADGGSAWWTTRYLGEVDWAVRILKLRANGSQQWSRTYRIFTCPTCDIHLQASSDGGFFLSENRILMKLNRNGDLIWKKSFWDGGNPDRASIAAFAQIEGGDIVITGEYASATQYAARLDPAGSPKWSLTYATGSVGRVVAVGCDGLLIGSNHRNHVLVANVNPDDGAVRGVSRFTRGRSSRILSLTSQNDCSYVVAGDYEDGAGRTSFLASFARSGSLRWYKTIRHSSFGTIDITRVISTPNRIFVTGFYRNDLVQPFGVLLGFNKSGSLISAQRMMRAGYFNGIDPRSTDLVMAGWIVNADRRAFITTSSNDGKPAACIPLISLKPLVAAFPVRETHPALQPAPIDLIQSDAIVPLKVSVSTSSAFCTSQNGL